MGSTMSLGGMQPLPGGPGQGQGPRPDLRGKVLSEGGQGKGKGGGKPAQDLRGKVIARGGTPQAKMMAKMMAAPSGQGRFCFESNFASL